MSVVFSTIYGRLLRMVNRPSTETDVLNGVKDAINDAIQELQRDHGYAMNERLYALAYTGGSTTVSLSSVNSELVRNIISVQQVSASGTVQGKPLKVVSYQELQAMRSKYERTHTMIPPFGSNSSLDGWVIEDAYQQDMIAFIVGNALGLYPRPTSDVSLYINYHVWLPLLSGASDTNFFLDYASDVVCKMALKNMMFYMKDLDGYAPSKDDITDAKATLLTWDGQIKESMAPRITS